MRFGVKLVGLLFVVALVPILASIVLTEEAISAGERVLRPYQQAAEAALARSAAAYKELVTARKEQFRATTIAIAATWNGHIDDPAPRLIRRWRVLPEGQPSGDESAAFPESRWRPYTVSQPLPDGRTLEIEFVVDQEREEELRVIGELTQGPQITAVEQHRHEVYHWVFVALFAVVMAPVVGIGIIMARRIARRLALVARAARAVGAGDLAVRVAPSGRDEIAELGHAFNDMVTELTVSRARVAYLEKIGAWQDVARRLAHEIKNPLTPIQLAVQQLHTKYTGGEPQFRRLLDEVNEIVGEEIGTLRRLVDDFSAFAKLPRVEPAPLDLGELVADVVRGRPDWEGHVRADRQLLRRALVNLVENALQAGARGVTVRAERPDARAAAGPAEWPAGVPRRAHLIVDDDGPGVSAELRERIFEPYFTTKEHGTGLGLAIVKKIALEHGGTVTAHTAPQGGARFVIELPLEEKN
jgi:nitrogen fixation/metabolism regulation signal transduction histidine kinase